MEDNQLMSAEATKIDQCLVRTLFLGGCPVPVTSHGTGDREFSRQGACVSLSKGANPIPEGTALMN